MPMILEEQKPYIYDFKVSNKSGSIKQVKTNLHFLNLILKRMMRGYSPIIGVCGEQRDGKSFIGIWISYIVMSALSKKMDCIRNCVYDPLETVTKLKDLYMEVFMLDESSSSFHKREWWKRINIAFSKIIITQGRKVLLYIFVSPFINDIDKSFTKHFDFIIDVKKRGIIKVFNVRKKHRSMKEVPVYYFHLDDVEVPLKAVPKKLWEEYKKFSHSEKDRLEDMLASQFKNDSPEKKINDIKDILKGI